MAGTIDVGIIKPELGGSFAAGYRGAEEFRQQSEMNQMKLEQLKQDRAMLTQLQAKLRAAGHSDDPTFFFKSLIETGNPDYVSKGYEGLQRYRELQRADALLAREAPELYGRPSAAAATAAPTVAPAANALAPAAAPSGELVSAPILPPKGVVRTIEPGGAVGPEVPLAGAPAANALAPTVAAPAPAANALAAPAAAAPGAAATPDANARIRELRNKVLLYSSSGDPRLKAMADVYKAELQELTKPQTLSPGQQLYSGGRVVYTAPATQTANIIGVAKGTENPVYFDSRTNQQFTIGTDASGVQIRVPYTGSVNRSTSNVTATATSSPAGKSLAAEVGQRADASRVKAEGAAGIMENANMVREALNAGNVIAGPLAGVRTKFAQVLELAGAGDKEKLANTRTVIQGLAGLTLDSRSELKNQGAISNDETKLLERARSGNVEDMTIAELQQVVNISQRLAARMWSNHENLLQTMSSDPAAADVIRYYRPTMSLPQAIGEGKPKAQTEKRTQGLDKIFGAQPQAR